MKKKIKQLLLQHGGYATARKIYAKIESRNITRRYLEFIETGSAPLPNKVIFEPTQRCNLHCKMCYQDRVRMAAGEELTYKQITDFFDRNSSLQKVTLIGGEIFMRRDINEIIRHLNINHDLVISTNGTLLGEAEINILKQCDRLFTVCISLDGPRNIHDSIRQCKGSYDKTINTIKSLAPVLPVTVNLVIQDENIQSIPEFVDLCVSMGVKKITFELERIYSGEMLDLAIAENGLLASDIPIASKGRCRGYSHEKLRSVLFECQDISKRLGIIMYFDQPYLMNEIKACCENNLLESKKMLCPNIHTATIAPNGDVINCMQIRKPFGNILETPLEDIWNAESTNAFRKHLLVNNLTPLCENCSFMLPAPGSVVNRCHSLDSSF